MTSRDEATRVLERDLDPEAAGALLRKRIRAGEVPLESVEFAAWLGHPVAVLVVEPREPGPLEKQVARGAAIRNGWSADELADVLCWGAPA